MLTSLLYMYASIITLIALMVCLTSQEPVLTIMVICTVSCIGFILYISIRHAVDTSASTAAQCAIDETRALMCATKGIREVLFIASSLCSLKPCRTLLPWAFLPGDF